MIASGCGDDEGEVTMRGDVVRVTRLAATATAAATAAATAKRAPASWTSLRRWFVRAAEAQLACSAAVEGVLACVGTRLEDGKAERCRPIDVGTCEFSVAIQLAAPFQSVELFFVQDDDRDGRHDPDEPIAGVDPIACNGDVFLFADVEIDFPAETFSPAVGVKVVDACPGGTPVAGATATRPPGTPTGQTPTRPPTGQTPTPTATGPTPIATPTGSPLPSPSAGPSPTPTIAPTPIATFTPFVRAAQIATPADLIGGPQARARFGDYILENDQIRVIVQRPGRVWFGIGTYGGNIIDADQQRPGATGRDQFEEFILGLNIESTANYTDVRVADDGSSGAQAIVRASGVDDIWDFFNVSAVIRGLGVNFPASADDVDLPLTIQTDYTLRPGWRYVKLDSTLSNTGATPLTIYLAEILNGSGEIEVWQQQYGFGEVLVTTTCAPATYVPCTLLGTCDLCNVVAYTGENGGAGVSYGYVHGQNRTSTLSVSGVTGALLGQEILTVLAPPDPLPESPPNFTIPPLGTLVVTRYFAVGDGSVASILDVRNEILGVATGTLTGRVTSGGAPLADADVAVLGVPPAPPGPAKNVVDHFRTDADGRYRGTLPPGSYTVMAQKDGRCFDAGCGGSPPSASVTIPPDAVVTQDFTLPAAGRLRVTVSDAAGRPIPAKVQLVGFDPSPDPLNEQDILDGTVVNRAGVFGDQQQDALQFGIAHVAFADKAGKTGPLEVEPGNYELVVSRGPRYSAFRQPVTIPAGAVTTVAARIARVIDTAGFVASDFHVHSKDSPDSEVTRTERVATMLAEGMDFFTPSDHDFRADFAPTIAAMGVGAMVATAPSAEITTSDYGHFNAWPMTVDPSQLQGGAVDWGRAEPPGEDYPSRGAYGLTPGEIIAAAKADPGIEVAQVNHIRSFFGREGLDIDSALVPPRSHTDPASRRLDPAHDNLFDDGFDALEVWIGTDGRTGDLEHFVGENLGDWFNLLNQGIVRSGVANSDTHERRTTQINARTYVASAVTDPGALAAAAESLATNVRTGRAIGTNAPFVTILASAASTGENAGLGVAQTRTLRTTNGAVSIRVDVKSPLWAEFDRVEFYVNNAPQPFDHDGEAATRNRYRVCPNFTRRAGADFTVLTVDDFPGVAGAKHLEATATLALTGLTADTWLVTLVRGSDGVSRPLFPVIPNSLRRSGNQTLAALTDGNLGEDGVVALAFTNPILIDVDGNGWQAPGVRLGGCS